MEVTLNTQTINAFADALAQPSEAEAFRATVARLRRTTKADEPLGDFLAELASLVADLYAATSVAIWFLDPSSHGLRRKIDLGWSNLRLDEATESAHERLVEFALHSPSSLAVPPFAAPQPGASVSNPTDSFLLLTTAKLDGQNVAVLEIALGPKPLRRPHQVLVKSYLEWLAWLSGLLQAGLERGFSRVDRSLQAALHTLQQTSLTVDQLQDEMRAQIELSLQTLAGHNYGSLAANQAITRQVHALLDSKGLRVKCPECGTPAILRCQNAGNARTGAFMYDHYLDSGRTFHGGQSIFPKLEVVAKAPRRRASK